MIDYLLISILVLAGMMYLLYKMNGRSFKGMWKRSHIAWAIITYVVAFLVYYVFRRAMLGK